MLRRTQLGAGVGVGVGVGVSTGVGVGEGVTTVEGVGVGVADSFNGSVPYVANHDVTLCAVSRAPLAKLQAYKRRKGWSFPWASSFGGDFNYDFQEVYTKEQSLAADVQPYLEAGQETWAVEWAGRVGTDWATYRRQMAGISAFALEDGDVYTYSVCE